MLCCSMRVLLTALPGEGRGTIVKSKSMEKLKLPYMIFHSSISIVFNFDFIC